MASTAGLKTSTSEQWQWEDSSDLERFQRVGEARSAVRLAESRGWKSDHQYWEGFYRVHLYNPVTGAWVATCFTEADLEMYGSYTG